jgi:hypothetical protein
MSNELISGENNEHVENNTKKPGKDGFLEEYLDMDYIKSLRLPTKDSLIDAFDNNLLILLVIGVMIVFFLLN